MPTPAVLALHTPGDPGIELHEVELPDPSPHQLLVRVEASGICRSQLREADMHTDGSLLPLGHEGLGVVVSVGAAVTEYRPGDRVVLSWVPLAGEGIRPAEWVEVSLPDGTTTDPTTVFTWATHTLVDELFAIPADPVDTDPALSLVGCALITGLGSAVYAGQARLGENIAVIGAGGVGLAAIVGAASAGAANIAVIDVDDEKLNFARRFGATSTINSLREDPVEAVREVTGRLGEPGADLVIDCVGIDATLSQAVDMARGSRIGSGPGGRIVVAGLGDGTLSVDTAPFLFAQKSIIGTMAGGMGRREILDVLAATRSGRVEVAGMVTDTFALDELNDAIDRLRAGRILGRGILVLPAAEGEGVENG